LNVNGNGIQRHILCDYVIRRCGAQLRGVLTWRCSRRTVVVWGICVWEGWFVRVLMYEDVALLYVSTNLGGSAISATRGSLKLLTRSVIIAYYDFRAD